MQLTTKRLLARRMTLEGLSQQQIANVIGVEACWVPTLLHPGGGVAGDSAPSAYQKIGCKYTRLPTAEILAAAQAGATKSQLMAKFSLNPYHWRRLCGDHDAIRQLHVARTGRRYTAQDMPVGWRSAVEECVVRVLSQRLRATIIGELGGMLHLSGRTFREIGRMLGVSGQRVHQLVKKAKTGSRSTP
jgi:predicted transcriptional regulator